MKLKFALAVSLFLVGCATTPTPVEKLPRAYKDGTFAKNELCAFINARYLAYGRYCSAPFSCKITKNITKDDCILAQAQYNQCRQDLAAEEKSVVIYCTHNDAK